MFLKGDSEVLCDIQKSLSIDSIPTDDPMGRGLHDLKTCIEELGHLRSVLTSQEHQLAMLSEKKQQLLKTRHSLAAKESVETPGLVSEQVVTAEEELELGVALTGWKVIRNSKESITLVFSRNDSWKISYSFQQGEELGFQDYCFMSRIKRFQPIIDSMILPAIESARSVHSLSELSGVYAFVTSQVARIHAILKQLQVLEDRFLLSLKHQEQSTLISIFIPGCCSPLDLVLPHSYPEQPLRMTRYAADSVVQELTFSSLHDHLSALILE